MLTFQILIGWWLRWHISWISELRRQSLRAAWPVVSSRQASWHLLSWDPSSNRTKNPKNLSKFYLRVFFFIVYVIAWVTIYGIAFKCVSNPRFIYVLFDYFFISHYVFCLFVCQTLWLLLFWVLGYFCTFYKYSKSIELCSGVHLNYLARLSV